MHVVSIILLIVLLSSSLSVIGFSLYVGISPMPSSSKAKKGIVSVIPKDTHIIYELGSGWGGLAFALSNAFPFAQLHAFEISPLPWIFATCMQKITGHITIQFHKKNFFFTSLAKADVIVCYLYPKAMNELKKKFEQELKPGTWVISNAFTIPGWTPVKVVQLKDVWKSEIFVYQRN